MPTYLQPARGGPRCPLLMSALAYAAGILLAQHYWRPRLWWLAAVVAFLAGTAVFALRTQAKCWRGWLSHCCVLACAVALGALGHDARWAGQPDRRGWDSLTDGEQLTLTGHVVRDGLLRGSGASRRQSVDLQLESVSLADQSIPQASNRTEPGRRQHGPDNRRKERPRLGDPCRFNAAWPAELVAASGLAGCSGGMRSAAVNQKHQPDAPAQPSDITPSDEGSSDYGTSSVTKDSANVLTAVPQGVIRISVYSAGTGDPEASDAQNTAAIPQLFTYGQRLRFPVRLRPPRNFGNPGSLDYSGYLRAQDIYALGSVRADRISLLDSTGGSKWELWRSRVRRSLIAKVHALWPPQQAALLDAMLIGERSFIGRDTSTAFQRTGIYHILVVSGMNVGILAFVVFWMLRRLRCGEVAATVVTILLSCGYAYVAEAGAPIVRSVVMLAIYLCTRLLYRERALLNALGAAALALMVVDPRAVTEASFQLTFFSVLAICGIGVPLIERTSQPYRRALRWLGSTDCDLSLEPRLAQFRIDLRTIADRLARLLPRLPKPLIRIAGRNWRKAAAQSLVTRVLTFVASAYELLAVSFTTQLALAQPMAWYFHRATVIGLPANLIAIPLTGVLMPASVCAVALSYVWIPLARIPARITSWSVSGITRTVNVLGGIRAADLRIATPEPLPIGLAALAFAAAVLLARKPRPLAASSLAALCATALWIAVVPPKPRLEHGKLEITGIDVGQAESFLVVTPEGRTLLVDAAGSLGPWQSEFDFGEDVIAPYLWSRGITRLDAVCITHAHSDHYGGMASIVKIFRPGEVWVGPNAPDRGFEALMQQATEQGVRIVHRAGGETLNLGGAQLRVLAPLPAWQTGPRPRNDDSLVLWFGYGNTSALLEADAEKASEHRMLGDAVRSDLLKVAHNGSNSSTTPEFLAQVQPRYALISVGARNSFGHPRPEVLERLAAMHVRTYRTDLLGAVTFLLDGKGITAKIPMIENR